MSTVGFITRDLSGTTRQSTFSEGTPSSLDTTQAKDISLNLSASDIDSYARRGADLHLVLADGQILVLQNFYGQGTPGGKNLFLSEEGDFVEVILEDKAEGVLFASYEPLDLSGKWSAYDDMVFLDVDRIEPVIAPLAAPLFGGLGAAGAAAGVAGAAVIAGGGGGGGGGGGNGNVILPTVDNPDATYPIGGNTTDPVVITGTGIPGSEVEVDMGGITQTTIIGDDGTWEVTFPVTDLPVDGNYDTTVQVIDPGDTTYDLDGPTVIIDTTPPEIEVTSGTQSTGDVVNGSEQSSGTVITGTGEAGATVLVEINGFSHSTTVGGDGSWSVTFDASEIATGDYSTGIAITTTDDFDNSSSYTETLVVDTETALSFNTVEGDNMVNAAEASDGVTLTGTGEAGAAISVVFQGVTQTTTVAGDGSWSVSYDASDIASGTYDSSFTVTATDLAGNTITSSHDIRVDTEVDPFTVEPNQTSNDIINQDELTAGFSLQGTVEPGSSVVVTINSVAATAIVDAAGNWSVAYDASDFPRGEYEVEATIVATDALGNSETLTETFEIDTVFEAPVIDQITNDISTEDLTALSIEGVGGTHTISALEGDGTASTLSATEGVIGGSTWAFLDTPVPDGTDLVVSNVDSLNNTSSTLIVLEDNATTASTLDHAALGGFNIDELDLATTVNVQLELDEATIKALSENSDTLTIHSGDSDDTVTVTDATLAGTRNVGGEAYNVYTVGNDGTTLVIDQDINVNII